MAHISRRLKAAERSGRAGFPDFETKTMTTGKYAKSLLVSSEVIQQTSDVDDIPDKPTNQPQKVSSPAPSHHIRKCHQNSSHQLELDNFGQDVFSSGRCHFFLSTIWNICYLQICLECFAQKLQALVNHCNVLHRVSPLMSLSCLCVHTDLSGLLYLDRSDVMHRVEHLHHVQSGRLSHYDTGDGLSVFTRSTGCTKNILIHNYNWYSILIYNIECCRIKLSHGHDLEALDPT